MSKTIVEIPEPKLARFFFADTRMALFWFFVRIYVGLQWLEAGLDKLSNPAWVGGQAGTAVQGFLMGAMAKTVGAHPDVSSWYASFIQNFALHHSVLFSYMVTGGEILVGIALILGLFTGIAAFFGSFMNMNYMLAGTVSINPTLFFFGALLMLSWRVSGWFGLDRYVLPALGTPWQKGSVFK